LPLSVRDARRAAEPLRARLAARSTTAAQPSHRVGNGSLLSPQLTARGVTVRYGDTVAVRELDLTLRPGEVVALMGRNGSGKSSLLWALQGAGRRQAGSVDVAGHETRSLGSREARRLVGLVPQTASDLLYLETVADECRQGDHEADMAAGSCWALLVRLAPDIEPERHPRDLSEGQRLALVLAVQLIAAPRVMLLDEPTRGLDYGAKAELAQILDLLCAEGKAVVVSTHDVEFVAGVADRVVVLADGEIVTDGAAVEVLAGSPSFAPQVAKILAPQPWLTVAQVRTALPDLIPTSR
ncbi:MAG: ATP-binding cassette domain-containing protein, partial [Actinomycetota bacterium]|nr:ATP-binding cassette domain-containing protein [Actinomycetota bacterium]